ncbi:MAG: extracellular solute-binding protein [Firmicutes bacterium]|nr:extracellular solute-binding protein [Bacillota bacterium]
MRKKRWGAAAGSAIVATALLAGCGGGANNAPQNTPSGTVPQQSTGGQGNVSGTLEIQYFVGGYGDAWWKQVIADFKKAYPNVTIKEDTGPQINTQMQPRWASGNPPDVVYIDGAGADETKMVESRQLMDLTDWAKTLKMEDGTPVLEGLLTQPHQYDGKIYTLPLVFDTWGTWYDAALFKQKGWNVPTDFSSWMDTMGKIKADGSMQPFVTTGVYPYYFIRGVLYPAFAAVGGDQLLQDLVSGKQGAWSSPQTLKVMQKVQQMQQAGYIDQSFAALNHTQSQMNWLLHKDAFIPVGFWLPNEMKGNIPNNFEFGFIPTPMNDPGTKYHIIPDLRPLAIAKNAKNPDAAKAFVAFVFEHGQTYAKTWSEMTGAMLNVKGVDLSNDNQVPNYLKSATAMINDPSKVELNHLPYPMSKDLETPISNALISLMQGKIDAQTFCSEAEKAAASYRASGGQ